MKSDRSVSQLRVVFVSAEFAPMVKVGGLGEAAAGLVAALGRCGVRVDVVVPDYDGQPLEGEVREPLSVPSWAGPAVARHGVAKDLGRVTLINAPGIQRPHPYVDTSTGEQWPDNDRRFFAFAAAVAELVALDPPDVIHLNDWHTSAVSAFVDPALPTVLTIHNLAHQGQADRGWLANLGPQAAAFDHLGAANPLAGGIRLADAVVAVSASYAREVLNPSMSYGLENLLAAKGDALSGIRNGIARDDWNPTADKHLAACFSDSDLAGKHACRRDLLRTAGLLSHGGPVVGMVARLDHQKGIDIALSLAPMLNSLPARLILHGSGNPALARHARQVAAAHPGSFAVLEGYSDDTAHKIMAGSDLVLIPSRFEPCGLTQMQAMSYGTIPVVTDVGGLRDTVIDLDRDRRCGTGFVASRPDDVAVTDALCRAVHGWRNPARRARAQHRGMTTDWSWTQPASEYIELYQQLAVRTRRGSHPKGP